MMKGLTPAPATGAMPRVNLMPRAETERRERNALARRWGVGLLIALLVVALASTGAFWLKWSAQQRLATEQLRTTELLTELAGLSDVSQALALRTELQGFRADAMVAHLSWSGLFADLGAVLPEGVVVSGFDLTVGAAPVTDDPQTELGLTGALELSSATAIDIAPAVRSLQKVPGVSSVAPVEIMSETSGDQTTYTYRLTASFDQTLYTGDFAEEDAR